MALKILLQDHHTASLGVVKAGEVMDDDETRYADLEASRAPFIAHTDARAAVVDAYRLQRSVLSAGSAPSLYVMLVGAGLA